MASSSVGEITLENFNDKAAERIREYEARSGAPMTAAEKVSIIQAFRQMAGIINVNQANKPTSVETFAAQGPGAVAAASLTGGLFDAVFFPVVSTGATLVTGARVVGAAVSSGAAAAVDVARRVVSTAGTVAVVVACVGVGLATLYVFRITRK